MTHASLAIGSHRARSGPSSRPLLALAALGIPTYAAMPAGPLADAVFVAASALAAIGSLVALRAGSPVARDGWIRVVAALLLLATGNALTFAARQTGAAELGQLGEILFMLAYAPLFAAAYRFGRGTHRSDRTVILDAAIVGLAVVTPVWEFLVEKGLTQVTGTVPLMALAVPVIGTMLVSLAAPVLLFRYSRSPSAVLLVAGLVAMGIGDSTFAISTLEGASDRSLPANLLWLASYVLIALAAAHPSARHVGAARDPRPGSGDTTRLIMVAAGLLVAPLATIRAAVRAEAGDLVLFEILSLLVAALVVLRLQRTIAQLASADARFRRFIDHPGFLAIIKDEAGRHVFMNANAQAQRAQPDLDWYGRTDADMFPAEVAAERMEADATVRRTGASLVASVESSGRVWHTERFAVPGRNGEVAVLGVDITDQLRAEEEVRFQARLLASVRDAVIVIDAAGRFTYWNHGAEEILGFTSAEVLGRALLGEDSPANTAAARSMWQAVLDGEREFDAWQSVRRDGSNVWLEARVNPILGPEGVPTGYLGIIRDVSERKDREQELRRLGAAMAHATDAIVVTDGDDRVAYVNPAFESMTGVARAEVIGRRPEEAPEGRSFARALHLARQSATGWRGDLFDRRRDGSDLVAETRISPIASPSEPAAGFVTIKRDVTRERAAERAADRRARERVLIAETLGSLHAGHTPEETAAAVCSQVLKLPELSLASFVTFDSDGIARVIGQQHVHGPGVVDVALSRERSDYLRGRAERGPWVERWLDSESHPYRELLHRLGVVAHAYAPMVVDRAPIGLLIAGSSERGGVGLLTERLPALVEFAAIATTLTSDAVSSRNETGAARTRLRDVIDRRLFSIVFQPIVDLERGQVLGFEALARFDDGTPPDVQIQRAHALGLGLEVETACLGAAIEAAEGLPDGAWVNLNVSPEAILGGVVEKILPPTRREVVLEITEHQAISDYEGFRRAIAPIRDRVRLAVDDAGAGFASLRHIVELAPKIVKLDRSLVAGIGEDKARQAVVAGMARFAEAAGLVLIAEGIETDAELQALRRFGVTLGQGYLLGMPEAAPASGVAGRTPRVATRRRAHARVAA